LIATAMSRLVQVVSFSVARVLIPLFADFLMALLG
jgi:hypothetical protein